MTDVLWQLGAQELAEGFRAGHFTPGDALEACLQRIDAVQPALNAFVALRREAARDEAACSGARWRAGSPLSPLDGVPIAIKDNLLTADLPTTWGCTALVNYRSAHDELAVARVRAAGAVIVGKTNVPEFTLEGYTSNRLHGTTGNPWNPGLTPGGSSGGSVAAVASGCVPLALGTDGGGSIRRPAAYTGLVGLKPSIGAIAREHALPPLLLDFEVVGPIARNAQDARLLFEAIRGPAAADRRSYAAAAARKPLPERLRVLYVPALGDNPVDEQIAVSCRRFAERLESAGHRVETGALPLTLDFIVAHWPAVGQIGLASLFEAHPAWREGATPKYLEMAAQGSAHPAPLLWQIIERAEQLRRDCVPLFRQYDLVVTPSCAAMPWAADQTHPSAINSRPVGPRGHAVFTGWVNAAGLPALALPAEPAADGLPIGVQLIADYGRDEALLALAAQLASRSLLQRWQWPVP